MLSNRQCGNFFILVPKQLVVKTNNNEYYLASSPTICGQELC